jgi:cell wall-associated NlpC family hydrolase
MQLQVLENPRLSTDDRGHALPILRPVPMNPASHRRLAAPARRWALALAIALPLASHAAPDAAAADAPAVSADGVQRFLQERGLLDPARVASLRDSMLVQQVRDKASDLVLSAMNFLGVPYKRGGTTAEGGFDCSGFTRHVFEHSIGLVLPRRADEQARSNELDAVRRNELKPGDLVFFNTLRRTFSHVGIYIGEGKFIHSPKPGSEVRVDDLGASYWSKHFTGARRAPQVQGVDPNALPEAARAAAGLRPAP